MGTTPRGDPTMDRYRGHKLPVLVYRHPFQVGIGIALTAIGARALWFPASRPTSIDTLPEWLASGYAAALVIGGVGMVLGLVISSRTTWGLFVEQIGLWLASFGFLTYAGGLAWLGADPRTTMAIITMLALAGAFIVRSRAAMLDSQHSLLGIRQEKARRRGGEQ